MLALNDGGAAAAEVVFPGRGCVAGFGLDTALGFCKDLINVEVGKTTKDTYIRWAAGS